VRLVLFDHYRIGILDEDRVRDVTDVVPRRWHGTPYVMNEFIRRFETLRPRLENAANDVGYRQLSAVRLLPPIPAPRNLLAARMNYPGHMTEMATGLHTPSGVSMDTGRELGFFVKATGSICGPSDAIELPDLPGRSFDHEAELAIVIGREARAVSEGRAMEHVFGYTCLLDITLRMEGMFREERAMRKSYATFSPMGPVLVTADEIPDPGNLDVRLWVNGGLKQNGNTRDLIVGVEELVERASKVLTLSAGDVYTTGTPPGVGPIAPGDKLRMAVERIGELSVPVVARGW
jgi:2-keto-4-pentenoate hydratase/2-oxohepta-3-ene-1,7-dioic acid hydratase in catechol pathway